MDLSQLLPAVDAALGPVEPRPGAAARVGVGDAAKPAVIAALLRDVRAPALVVVPRFARAHDLAEELTFWLGPERGEDVRLYPERDVMPYERAADDPWDVRTRLDTTAALHRGEPLIVIASIEAVAQRTLSRRAGREGVSAIAVDARLTPDDLLRRLQDGGYEVVPLVEAPGQAARRGGIIDVYPPQADLPVRIEFFGPTVESIRSFDPATQRSQERLDSVDLGGAREFSPDSELAQELLQELDFDACEDEAGARLREEMEALAQGRQPDGPSFMPSLLSPYSLLDHLPADATVILDEPVDLNRALDEYVAETATMRIERESRRLLPPGLPPAQANWSDLQPALDSVNVVQLLRFLTEESGGIRPAFGPAPAFGGRVRVLSSELNEAARHHEAIVIVSQQHPASPPCWPTRA